MNQAIVILVAFVVLGALYPGSLTVPIQWPRRMDVNDGTSRKFSRRF